MIKMEHDNLPLKLRELQSCIEAELEKYDEEERGVILNRFLNQLQMKRHKANRLTDIKEVWRAPYIWLIVAGGIALPVLLYVIFVWSSLLLEA
ncbi:MAG: hypothetical protein ACQEXX_17470 [Bacillota bacterium]